MDIGVEAFGRNAPDRFGFRARSDGVKERRTQEKKKEEKQMQQMRICSFAICRCRAF